MSSLSSSWFFLWGCVVGAVCSAASLMVSRWVTRHRRDRTPGSRRQVVKLVLKHLAVSLQSDDGEEKRCGGTLASTQESFKDDFSLALGGFAAQNGPQFLHFAAHSHHMWPDVALKAQMECWLDAVMQADDKWGTIFGALVPRLQARIASVLSIPRGKADRIAFASNTQELFMRILSGIDSISPPNPVVILTSDSEFHSFTRQSSRLEEEGLVRRIIVPTQPFSSFVERFTAAVLTHADALHMIFLSQAFFNSGYALLQADVERVVASVPRDDIFVVLDAYHGFCAVPTDLSKLHTRMFYMAGGYKYAMSGEGCCFLVIPDGYAPRPRNTGWFASFDALAEGKKDSRVSYSETGSRFLGSTMDNTALYRMCAVLGWMEARGLSVQRVHAYVIALQEAFLEKSASLAAAEGIALPPLLNENPTHRSRFLTFQTCQAAALCSGMAQRDPPGVLTDCREDRWRLGFGLYHDKSDVLECAHRFVATLKKNKI